MRIKNLLLKCSVVVLAGLVLSSCRKTTDLQADNPNPNRDLAVSVKEWFGTIKAAGKKDMAENTETGAIQTYSKSSSSTSSNKSKAISNIIENLTLLEEHLFFNKAIFTEQGQNYNLIVIPINDALKAKKRVSAEASLNLALVTDKTGKFISGNIMCFYPSDKRKRNHFSPQLIADFMKGKPFTENGKIRVLSLTGRWLREFDIKDSKVVSNGTVQSKKETDGKKLNSTCTNWYLVTTYHYSDGSSSETWEYIGTTCSGSGINEHYDHVDDGLGDTRTIQTETESETTNEYVDAGTGGPSTLSTPPVAVRYVFVKYIEYDYWGIIAECYYVNVHNAQLVSVGYPFITEMGNDAFMIATLSNHSNSYMLLGGISVRAMWSYTIDWSVVVTGGSDYFGSTPIFRSRVG